MNSFRHAMFERGLKYPDLIGKRVRLRRLVKTRSGNRFFTGRIMYVIASHRGRLTLSETYGGKMAVWRMGTGDLEFVPPDPLLRWKLPKNRNCVSATTSLKECAP